MSDPALTDSNVVAARAEGLSAAQALDAEALAACGLRVTQTERFYCEPKTKEA